MNDVWYKKQIYGLYLILDDSGGFIDTEYVKEKLLMINSGIGINFHPTIKEHLDELEEKGHFGRIIL